MERENLRLWKEKITTTGLIAINLFLFVICLFSGELLYSEGAFSLRYLLQGREWWRLVTSMFLHADVDHLVGNMLMLYLAGELVERYVGKRKFVILYFFSGAAGSLFGRGLRRFYRRERRRIWRCGGTVYHRGVS